MKFILSPARIIRKVPPETVRQFCGEALALPVFLDEAAYLLDVIRKYSPWELMAVLKTSEKIAYQAFIDFQELDFHCSSAVPAVFGYDGLVFKYLEPHTLRPEALRYGENAMRILSAFYGILRPMDFIAPYRLEMRTPLSIDGKSLYGFWSDRIYKYLYLNQEQRGEPVVNLASEEYASLVRRHLQPGDRFIDIVFLSVRQGKNRTVTTEAKMARGKMARFILDRRIEKPQELERFKWQGYQYEKSISSGNKMVFLNHTL